MVFLWDELQLIAQLVKWFEIVSWTYKMQSMLININLNIFEKIK